MPHPFKDKLVVFLGRPINSSRQAVRDALAEAGGFAEDRITTFIHYVIAFSGAEKTKA
jgi:NAD-dependent DNA ligase